MATEQKNGNNGHNGHTGANGHDAFSSGRWDGIIRPYANEEVQRADFFQMPAHLHPLSSRTQ